MQEEAGTEQNDFVIHRPRGRVTAVVRSVELPPLRALRLAGAIMSAEVLSPAVSAICRVRASARDQHVTLCLLSLDYSSRELPLPPLATFDLFIVCPQLW